MVASKRLKYLAMREHLFVKFYKTIDSKKSNCLLLNISIDGNCQSQNCKCFWELRVKFNLNKKKLQYEQMCQQTTTPTKLDIVMGAEIGGRRRLRAP